MSNNSESENEPKSMPAVKPVSAAKTTSTVKPASAPEVKSKPTAPASVAEVIWNEIKDKKIELYSLPAQTVSHFCKQAVVEPSKLYLTTNTPVFLPALEMLLKPKYDVELVEKYIVVSKNK